MRIVILGSWAPSLVAFRGHLIASLVARGHDVIGMAAEHDVALGQRLRDMGARYCPISLRRTGMNPAEDIRTLGSLISSFRRERPELILAYTAKPVIYGLMAARLTGVPLRYALITGLGYSFQGQHSLRRRALTKLMHGLYKASLSGSDGVLFQNTDDRDLFLESGIVHPRTAVTLVPGSGVDVEHYSGPPPAARARNFLLIARVLREKGIHEYVRAARHIRQRHPECRFRVLGPVDEHPNAVSRVDLEGWEREGTIEYLGVTSDVRPFLSACDVYVLPSYREGMPRSVLEAMAMERPIITTDAAGCRQSIIDGEHGFIVAAQRWEPLAEACERFISDPALVPRMGRASRLRAEELYDVRRVTTQILDALGVERANPTVGRVAGIAAS